MEGKSQKSSMMKNLFSSSLPVLLFLSSSLLPLTCLLLLSLFPISSLFFLPSYRDVSSRLDCFLLISSPWVVFVRPVCTEVKQANLPALLDTTHTLTLCVRARKGNLKLFGVCWRTEGQRRVLFLSVISQNCPSRALGEPAEITLGTPGVHEAVWVNAASILQWVPLDFLHRSTGSTPTIDFYRHSRIYSWIRWCRRSHLLAEGQSDLVFPESSSQ